MATYTVTIYESLTHTIEVEASFADEATERAIEQYGNGNLITALTVKGVTKHEVATDDFIIEVDPDDEDEDESE